MDYIKETLENGVCSNRAYSPGTANGNNGFLKINTKTENIDVVRKGKFLRYKCNATCSRFSFAFIVWLTMMISADLTFRTANLNFRWPHDQDC